jgi:hypothetical protein
LEKITAEEKKKYNRNRLLDLSTKSIGEIPQPDELTYEQKMWVLHRLKQPSKGWQRWFVGLYFTDEQKKEVGLTDDDIAGRGTG